MAEPRKGMRRFGGRSGGKAHRDPPIGKMALHCLHQRTLATGQMGAASDIEHDAIGRLDRDHRCVAGASVGKPVEQFGIGYGIVVVDRQFGHNRPRIGQTQSRCQPGLNRRAIERHQPHCPLLLLDKGQRRFRR